MPKYWAKSRWIHGLVSLIVAPFPAYFVLIRTENASLARYAQQYPHDGQDGLGALSDALNAGLFTFVVVFFALFMLQRALVHFQE